MVDFLCNFFKSEETKINEEYEMYKNKYGDKIKILRQGNAYAIQDNLTQSRYCDRPVLFSEVNSLAVLKKVFIQRCEWYERMQQPIIEI